VTYLALGDCPQSLDNRELDIRIGSIIQEAHHRLHHPRCGLLELGMFLGEEEHLVIEEVPIAGVFSDGDDGDQEARCRGEVGSLLGESA